MWFTKRKISFGARILTTARPLRGHRKPRKNRSVGRIAARIAGLSALLILVGLIQIAPEFRNRLMVTGFDAWQQIAPRQQAGAPVTVVDIDEASLARIGQWPWARSTIARLVDRLGESGAAAIAFDIVFAEPDRLSPERSVEQLRRLGATVAIPPSGLPDGDDLLASAFRQNPVVAGLVLTSDGTARAPEAKAGFAFGGEDPTAYLPDQPAAVTNLPGLRSAAAGLGVFSLMPGMDGVIRNVPLIARSGSTLLPSLSVEALRVAQGAGSITLRSTGASGEIASGAPAMRALSVGAFDVPTSADGSIWVGYSGLSDMRTIPAFRILEDDYTDLATAIEGHIVLIGTSAAGLRDLVVTPTSPSLPGVNVHAEIIDSIVGADVLQRPDWAAGAELALAVVLGLVSLLLLPRIGPLWASLLTAVLVGGIVALSFWLYDEKRLLIDPLFPSLGTIVAFVGAAVGGFLASDRERRFVRSAFGRYLAPSLVEELANRPEQLKLGGEERELTVLFCDIRGFTALSENRSPEELTTLLNACLTPLTDCLLKSGATIDKYMGDAIMAFWNAPLDVPDHRNRAIACALDMLAALDRLNAGQQTKLKIGIGLHSGLCCVGNLGSEQRFSYSAIGDAVNLASRVEGLTKQYGCDILLTEAVAEQANGFALLPVDRVAVVGRGEPVTLFSVLGGPETVQSSAYEHLKHRQDDFLAAYREGEWSKALERLIALDVEDRFGLCDYVSVMRHRLAELAQRQDGSDAQWDGIWKAREK